MIKLLMLAHCSLTALLLLTLTVCGQEVVTKLNPVPSMKLDMDKQRDIHTVVEGAVKQEDISTLLLVMRERSYMTGDCLNGIDALPKTKKVQALILVLNDERILKPAPYQGYIPIGSTTFMDIKHTVIQKLCYEMLGEPPPPKWGGWLTRAQLDALAARLRTLP